MHHVHPIFAILLALLTIVTAAPAVAQDDVSFFLANNCPFPVYVREAVAEHPGHRQWEKCANFGESRGGVLLASNMTWGMYPVYKDSCGHSVKVARYPGGPVYQFEFTWTLEDDRMWYNLSHEDGNPFTDVEREISAQGGWCPAFKCDPGNDGSQCDYGIQGDCGNKSIMMGFLCGRVWKGTSDVEAGKSVGIWDLPPAVKEE